MPSPARLVVHPEVTSALARGGAVVALESTIISHGLPRPDNLAVARQIEQAVRDGGAVPATIAVVGGVVRVGLDDDALATIATADDVAKASVRDLALVAARGGSAATTVAATAHLAAEVGIGVFATGGLGGVHRGAADSFDESADLTALSRVPITVVCAGVKSILDVGATLERLETLGVSVVGYGTDRFPGFYRRDSGFPVDWRVDSPEEVVAVLAARSTLGTDDGALIVANPVAEDEQVEAGLHDRVLEESLAAAAAAGIRGKAVTPFLLERFHRETGGESLRANVAIILGNAALAARIAAAAALA
ncbi:MAG TPA: pseudouridine-5'-phosphate glycosidase [Acidimicrobiales bacterium]|nr:pseudouridine-5'-phosphate glycosidase [Acidimicrobiales bacterium]